jgi:hypothetical protein
MDMAVVIVGRENSVQASSKFGKKEFNNELKDRKLVRLDEAESKGERKESYKKWLNDLIPVEAKGKDPLDVENHASFILATNIPKNVNVTHLDRRFSIPALGARNLKDVIGADETVKFQDWIKTEEFGLTFPYVVETLLENAWNGLPGENPGRELEDWEKELQGEYGEYRKHIKYGAIKGDAFYRHVEISKTDWFKGMKQLLTQQSFLELKDVKKLIKGIGHDKIKETLDLETEERRDRDIKPYEVCKIVIDLEGIKYVSNIYVEPELVDSENM